MKFFWNGFERNKLARLALGRRNFSGEDMLHFGRGLGGLPALHRGGRLRAGSDLLQGIGGLNKIYKILLGFSCTLTSGARCSASWSTVRPHPPPPESHKVSPSFFFCECNFARPWCAPKPLCEGARAPPNVAKVPCFCAISNPHEVFCAPS